MVEGLGEGEGGGCRGRCLCVVLVVAEAGDTGEVDVEGTLRSTVGASSDVPANVGDHRTREYRIRFIVGRVIGLRLVLTHQ